MRWSARWAGARDRAGRCPARRPPAVAFLLPAGYSLRPSSWLDQRAEPRSVRTLLVYFRCLVPWCSGVSVSYEAQARRDAPGPGKIAEDPACAVILVPPDCPDPPRKPDLPRKPAPNSHAGAGTGAGAACGCRRQLTCGGTSRRGNFTVPMSIPRRARTIVSCASRAPSLERLVSWPAAPVRDALTSLPGVGVWTAAETGPTGVR